MAANLLGNCTSGRNADLKVEKFVYPQSPDLRHCEGLSQILSFLVPVKCTVRFGPVGWVCRLPGLRWGPGNQAGRVQEDGPGRGHRSRGSGEGPRGAQTRRVPLYLSPAGQLFRTGEIFFAAPEELPELSNSIEYSLF